MQKNPLQVADFFVIRTPRLSLKLFQAIPAESAQLNDFLRTWLQQPGVREALYLASPSLLERVDQWYSQPKQDNKLNEALLKYLIRMSCRPTPFGLFSGISLGKVAAETALKPAQMQQDQRITRLDMFYLNQIRDHLTNQASKDSALSYVVNPTLFRFGDRYHYIESYQSEDFRQYRLSVVNVDEVLTGILAQFQPACTLQQLVDWLTQQYPDNATEEIWQYVQQLRTEGVIQTQIKLPLTSGNPDEAFVRSLAETGHRAIATGLQDVITALRLLDKKPQNEPADYLQIYQQLKQLPFPVSANKLFQTDVLRSFEHCELGQGITRQLGQGLLALMVLQQQPEARFQEFSQQFNRRFEGQFVPLLQLLDEEAGISFSSDVGYATPLLAGININNRQRQSSSKFNPLEFEVLKTLGSLPAATVQLSATTLLKEQDLNKLAAKLPASFASTFACYQDADAQPLIHFQGCYGPSAANLIGRFCHLSAELTAKLQQHLALEQAASPDVIFAEIVHMPDGRPGNVIARPALRPYEIIFWADTEQPAEYQIPVADLYVFYEQGQLKLWSRRLQRQIIPRLSCAHNYSGRSLGIYRFLAMLQGQDVQLPFAQLPEKMQQMKMVPRVQIDQLIILEQQWQVERKDIVALIKDDCWQPEQWQQMQQDYQLHRYVTFAMADNVLTLDLHNIQLVKILLAETQHRKFVTLKEALHCQYQPLVSHTQGDFAHEILLPFFNPQAKKEQVLHDNPAAQLDQQLDRYFAPGSDWLSLKIYAAQSTAELVLLQQLQPFVQHCLDQQWCQSWFFIRYGDPDWHLRLRFNGEPALLHGQILPALQRLLAPQLQAQLLHRIEVFTYQREVERYGGAVAMLLSEQIFRYDSELVLAGLQLIASQDESVRWRLALLAVHAMLQAFGYDAAAKLALISHLRTSFGAEFQEHAQLRQQLGSKYREFKPLVESDFSLLWQSKGTGDQVQQELQLLVQQFMLKISPLADEIRLLQAQNQLACSLDTLLASLLHMLNNRLFKAYGREQEFVIYDFLRRLYLAQQARQPVVAS